MKIVGESQRVDEHLHCDLAQGCHVQGSSITERFAFFVGQIGNLRPIGNRPFTHNYNGATSSSKAPHHRGAPYQAGIGSPAIAPEVMLGAGNPSRGEAGASEVLKKLELCHNPSYDCRNQRKVVAMQRAEVRVNHQSA